MNPFEDVGKLKTQQDKNKTVEDEGERVPDGGAFEAGAEGEIERTFVSEIETADDGGENAGSVGAFACEICEVRGDEADGDFDGRVVNFGFEVVDQLGDDETDHDAAGDQVEKPFDRGWQASEFRLRRQVRQQIRERADHWRR